MSLFSNASSLRSSTTRLPSPTLSPDLSGGNVRVSVLRQHVLPSRHCHLIYREAMLVSSSGLCFDSLRPPHLSSAEEVSANLASLGPQYLSSRSGDVILSDICPIQLKTEALCSIKTFLNEFLWNILSTARLLVTDRIEAGVLKILPTNLGKAALLEVEVELKVYWECTNLTSNLNVGANDTLDFPLQWSYEVS